MEHINTMILKEIESTKWTKLEVSEADLPWSPTSGSSVTPNTMPPAPI
jgi:hypothetical protein